jgi:hypothetical protein
MVNLPVTTGSFGWLVAADLLGLLQVWFISREKYR